MWCLGLSLSPPLRGASLKLLTFRYMKRFIFALIVGLCAVCVASAQENKKHSDWEEVQTVVIPAGQTLNEGVTKSGNPKYWFEFAEIGKVSVSPSSAEKYKEGSVSLILVKWYNKVTDKYRYSVRQNGGREKKEVKNVDLGGLFK